MKSEILNELYFLSKKASRNNEIPVAAILTLDNKIVAKAYNKRNFSNLTTSHAEIIVIEKANIKLKSWRLNECELYVTIKPCEMCQSVIKEARISKVYYLLDSFPEKKQYNKTVFKKISSVDSEIITDKYKIIINDFWAKIRNK